MLVCLVITPDLEYWQRHFIPIDFKQFLAQLSKLGKFNLRNKLSASPTLKKL